MTVPLHAGRDLKRGTVQGILRQAGLTVEQFIALIPLLRAYFPPILQGDELVAVAGYH